MAKVVIEIAKGQNADQVLDSLRRSAGSLVDSIKLLDDTQRRAEGTYRALAAQLDPNIRKTQELERAQRILDTALKRNIVSQEEYNRLLTIASAKYADASGHVEQYRAEQQRLATQGNTLTETTQRSTLSIKDLTKSIGAGVSVFSILRSNIQDLAPSTQRLAELARESGQAHGIEAAALDQIGLRLRALIDPRKQIAALTRDMARASEEFARRVVGESTVIATLSKAQLQAVDAYRQVLAMSKARDASIQEERDANIALAAVLANRAQLEMQQGAVTKRTIADIQNLVDAYSEAGEAVPERLAEIVESLGILSQEQQDALDEEKKASEAARRELGERMRAIDALEEKYDPLLKQQREYAEIERTLAAEVAAGNITLARRNEILQNHYQSSAVAQNNGYFAPLQIEPLEIQSQLESANLTVPVTPKYEIKGSSDDLQAALDQVFAESAANLEDGLTAASKAFVSELIYNTDDAFENLAHNLTDILVQSAIDFGIEMLAQILKAKAMAKTIDMGTSSTGGGMSAAGWGAMGAGIAIAVMAAYTAASNAAVDEQYNAGHRYYFGGISGGDAYSGYRFPDEALEAGNTHDITPLTQAIESFMDAFREAIGGTVTSIGEVAVEVRNDGEEFQAVFQGEVLGRFKTVEEALVAGIQAAFRAGDFEGVIDPIIQQVIENYSGDKTKLFEVLAQVKGIVDEVSGLSDIEIALRDLPAQTAQVANGLEAVGVSAGDAATLAAQWNAVQLQNIRDQITGHEQSQAEQLAQKQREAEMFNAQLALDKAKIEAEKLALENQIAIEQARVEAMNAGAEASVAVLNAQLAAYGQILSVLDSIAPIAMGEIRIGGGRGRRRRSGGGSSGPSKEDRIESAMSGLGLESVALDQRLDALAESLRFLREQGALSEAQMAELGQSLTLDLLGQMASVIDDQETLAELEELRYDIQKANWLIEIERLKAIGAINEQQYKKLLGYLNALPEDLPGEELPDHAERMADALDRLGLESVQSEQEFQDLKEALDLLRRSGEITEDQLAELGQSLFNDLLGQMAQAADDSETLAMLEEIRYDAAKANWRIEIERLHAIGAITEEQYQTLSDYLDGLADDLPTGEGDTGGGGGGGGSDHQNDLLEQIRDAIEDLLDFQRDLWASELSPLNAGQQVSYLEQQMNAAYQAATTGPMAGRPEAIALFQQLAQQYLQAYQTAYGSTGAGYTQEFFDINEMINALAAMYGMTGITPGPGIINPPAGGGNLNGGGAAFAGGTVLPFERRGGPSSPFVTESPAIERILSNVERILDRRLEEIRVATEANSSAIESMAVNDFFRASAGPIGITGNRPRRR